MTERILQLLHDLKIMPFTIEKGTNGHITRVAARKILDGRTKKPRVATLEILMKFLSEHYKVSREWMKEGIGEVYLKDEDDCFLEKHGVRFNFDELLKHFIENQEIYLGSSESLNLAFVNNIVKNKDFYIENSEYFRLFIKGLVEDGIEERLKTLKDIGVVVKKSN
ncbi:hypothetical protein U8527_06690 [Kordia algicida OT-1]|uniref:Uncharacterized protein n=1 Tax=Kordia algicida OT-1 TaxID=391587 RepID=A9CU88_9FLAO|nr:hypothetical protein [Kordia algicida]EDP94137.1 hypothetical protein KAOT1_00115 [Kordia algicida OT-1]